MSAILEFEHVSFRYPDAKDDSLRDLSLSLEEGSFTAVLGHNGSGKSTLAKLMNMILVPDSGRIYIDGRDITDPSLLDDEDAVAEVRKNIGMVFQNPDNQLVATVVEEDIAFGPENLGVAPEEIRRRVDEALRIVGMSDFARHSPHQLSGGQKQRIAIAGIIAILPECIVFDESTAMLDPSGRKEVMDTIEELNRNRGITVITITHNMDEAVRADRVVVVDKGRIVKDGTPKQVFSRPEELWSLGLSVPQVTELFDMLRCLGADLPEGITDEEEGAKLLFEFIKNRN